jgi:hypothetical protein
VSRRAERQRLRQAHRREAMQMERARQIRISQLEAMGRLPDEPEYDEDAALRMALQASVATEEARLNNVDNGENNGNNDDGGGDGAGGGADDGGDRDNDEVVRDFMAITGVLDAAEARRYIALSDGNLEMAIRVFEDAFQIDDSAPIVLPSSPAAVSDMAIDSPAPPVRIIDLTQDSPVSYDTRAGTDVGDAEGSNYDEYDDDDASLAAAIAMSLNSDTAAADSPPPPVRTVSVRPKSELTELMEQQDRDFQAALTKDRERAAAAAAAAAVASSTASTASTADVVTANVRRRAATKQTWSLTKMLCSPCLPSRPRAPLVWSRCASRCPVAHVWRAAFCHKPAWPSCAPQCAKRCCATRRRRLNS